MSMLVMGSDALARFPLRFVGAADVSFFSSVRTPSVTEEALSAIRFTIWMAAASALSRASAKEETTSSSMVTKLDVSIAIVARTKSLPPTSVASALTE